MKRAALYARVSSDDQRNNYSIPTQLEDALRFARDQAYTVVGDQFVDPETGQDTSGRDGAVCAFVDDYTSLELSRPSLDAAIYFLDTVGYDVLVVHSLDRLARDPYIRRTLELELEQRGAKVEYVLGSYEDTPEGEVRKDLDATFGKWENAKRVERTLRGKRGKAQSGKFVAGKPAYGYYICIEAKGGLAVNEAQARIVIWIFQRYVNEGMSIRQIAKRLTEKGIPNHSGRKKWGKSSVARILKNTTYIGRCYYNKNKRVGRKKLVNRPRAEWIEIEVTPIVDRALFDAAQARLNQNHKEVRRRPQRFYLLGGMVYCAFCERPYSSQTQKASSKNRRKNDKQSYRHRTKEGHCLNRQVSASRLEPVVWDEIVKLLKDPKTLREGYEQAIEQQRAKHARQRALLEQLGRQQVKLEQKLNNLTAAYIDPDIPLSKGEYLAQRVGVDNELKEVGRKIEELSQELDDIPTPAELATLEAFAAEVGQELDTELAAEEVREILDILHVKVYIAEGDNIRIEGWFRTQSSRLLSTASVRCAPQPPPPPSLASRAPGP